MIQHLNQNKIIGLKSVIRCLTSVSSRSLVGSKQSDLCFHFLSFLYYCLKSNLEYMTEFNLFVLIEILFSCLVSINQRKSVKNIENGTNFSFLDNMLM